MSVQVFPISIRYFNFGKTIISSLYIQNFNDCFSFLFLSCCVLQTPISTPTFSVCLQCLGQEVNLLIDTGCKLNLMSSLTVERLGWGDDSEHPFDWHLVPLNIQWLKFFFCLSPKVWKDWLRRTKQRRTVFHSSVSSVSTVVSRSSL